MQDQKFLVYLRCCKPTSSLQNTMKKAIDALKEILQESVETVWSPLENIKAVYWGDPVNVPLSSLPCIIIRPDSTDFTRRWSRYDQKERTITVIIRFSLKEYFDSTEDFKVNIAEECISMTGDEDSDHQTAPLTVCGTIQNNPSLQYTGWNAVTDSRVLRVEYAPSTVTWNPLYESIITIALKTVGDR